MLVSVETGGGALHLVVGLGNPGRRYAWTRHNVGFLVVDRLAAKYQVTFRSFDKLAEVASLVVGGQRLILAKPQVYMNCSGRAVEPLVRYFGLSPKACLIAYDDVALPLGKLRFRRSGSAGGHRGMASVLEALGTVEVPRLRLGIGRDDVRGDLRDFVLRSFEPEERPKVDEMLERAVEGVETFVEGGVDLAMAKYN
ncbi:MAG TPA: aminoacyl-tRNA hydrolase [Acidobacteriota bacterium]|nr:aminoacyl-tRNA hydrolase [Acidobacteriota bacterium]